MMKRLKIAAAGLALAATAVVPAFAVTWFVVDPIVMSQNIGGTDFQTTVTGQFDFDSDTSALTNIDLTIVNSGLAGEGTFQQYDGSYTVAHRVFDVPGVITAFTIFIDPSEAGAVDDYALTVTFAAPLLNSTLTSQSIEIVEATVGECIDPTQVPLCELDDEGGAGTQGGGGANNDTIAGAVSPVAQIPVPAALPLMIAGLAGLGFFARRRKAA